MLYFNPLMTGPVLDYHQENRFAIKNELDSFSLHQFILGTVNFVWESFVRVKFYQKYFKK